MTETKNCPKCGIVKLVSEFYTNKSKSDGLATHCKDCAREWRDANRDHLAEYNRKAREGRRGEVGHAAPNMNARWSESEDRELLRTDISLVQISKNLGRTYGASSARRIAVKERIERLAMIEDMRANS